MSSIHSKPSDDKYRDGWDKVFGTKYPWTDPGSTHPNCACNGDSHAGPCCGRGTCDGTCGCRNEIDPPDETEDSESCECDRMRKLITHSEAMRDMYRAEAAGIGQTSALLSMRGFYNGKAEAYDEIIELLHLYHDKRIGSGDE